MPRRGAAVRQVPDSGTLENIGVLEYTDLISGAAVKGEQVAQYGSPLQLVELAAAQSTLDRNYPYDGATPTFASNPSGANIDLQGDADPKEGMLLVVTTGSAIGEVRTITGVSAATVTLDVAITASLGDSYTLLADGYRMSKLIVKTEFQTVGASGVVIPMFFDFPRVPDATETKRKPVAYFDREVSIKSLDITEEVTQAGYNHGTAFAVDLRGAIGVKIRLKSISAGALSLWCGVV